MIEQRSHEPLFDRKKHLVREGMYDTVIVGGGIAGLSIAEHLVQTTQDSIALLERYPNLGGRIVSNHHPYSYEIGAGRISNQHSLVKRLVDRFQLKTYPIASDSVFNGQPNDFHTLFDPIRKVLQTIPPNELGNHTIAELVPPAMHPILRMFPYYAETNLLRADLALPLFANNGTMHSEYYGIVGGLDQLIENLWQALESTRVDRKTRYRVTDVTRRPDHMFEITGNHGEKVRPTPFTIVCKRVILATEYRSFRKFTVLRQANFLNHLTDSRLIRIYAVYPKRSDPKVWFHDLPKTVSDSPIRYIIPIDAEKGLIMISYTEGDDAKAWHTKNGEDLILAIQSELWKLYPHHDIPFPIFLRKHDWPQGCTYWKAGDYDLDAQQLTSMLSAMRERMGDASGAQQAMQRQLEEERRVRGQLEEALHAEQVRRAQAESTVQLQQQQF
jgi:hypothetical protein